MIPTIKRALSAIVGIHSEMFAKADPRDLVYALNRRIEYKNRELAQLQQQLIAEREAHSTIRERFRLALVNLGVSGAGVSRFLAGDEIEGDFVTARDHDIIGEISARQAAERELQAEREKHEALKIEHERECNTFTNECNNLGLKLASALDKIDKLTRTIDCGCGEPMALAWYCSECGHSAHVNIESLRALGESEGGDGK